MSELSIYSKIYEPDENTPIIGVVQLVHDMYTHQESLKSICDFLTENGYACITFDLKGHGQNLRRDSELGFFGDNSVNHLIGRVQENTLYIRENYPCIPYILLGQGFGALLATAYFKRYDNFVDGLFLFGMPGYPPLAPLFHIIVFLFKTFRGEYHRSPFLNKLLTGSFGRAFKEKYKYSWVSSDQEYIKKFREDYKCGFNYTVNGYETLCELLELAYKNGSWIKKTTECPVCLFFGEDDPCIGNKKQLTSVSLFTENGYHFVVHYIYPGLRHDLLNEAEKKDIHEDILYELNLIQENYKK